ncbi:TPA_asm: L [Pelargonium alphacytorhabdovirus 1]|nr:TPA_asm: L [Pelargonium alphacytorhabdovirus 1]
MAYYSEENDYSGSDDYQEVIKTVLPDYHLRNPLKTPKWLDAGNNRIPYRNRLDKVLIRSYFPSAQWGIPSDLNRRVSKFIPEMSKEPLGQTLSDLQIRLRMDAEIIPELCGVPIDELMEALTVVDNRYWNGMRFWNKIMMIMNAQSSNRDPPPGTISWNNVSRVSMSHGVVMTVCRTCVVLSQMGKDILYDGDWVRMASDVNTQRYLVLVGCAVGGIVNSDHYPSKSTVREIFSWGDDVLEEFGNNGFKLLKAFEAIVIGALQSRGEGSLINPRKFLQNTLRDLADDNPMFLTLGNKLVAIIDKLESFHHVAQVYGLHRVWGHPLVNNEKGLMKLRVIGQKSIIKDNTLSVDAGRMFKLLFSREYMKKHGSFPKIRDGMSILETKLLENDSTAVNKSAHLLKEWDRVKFEQAYELPESFNLSMIIADKAISPTKSELVTSIRTKNTVMDPDRRRGVKRWLEDTTLKPKEFLRDINDGKFDDDHKIIGLAAKERELNPVPRMFSLMSHQMRVFVVVTEQMLSDHILKMFPQITMTDTLLDLTKKMYATVKGQSSRIKRRNKSGSWVSRVICMSLDFEKWNGHMRKEMTSGVFSAIGRLFGLPDLFNATYDIFESSYYYLADGSYLPRVERGELQCDEPFSFTGHKGGMEGLRQKGWTIYTVCCLEVILSKYDCTYKIMGMGDNQVLQITVYSKKVTFQGTATEEGLDDMRRIIEAIFSDLVSSFTDAGLPLKPLETWMSEDLYLYGKVPLWKGVPLSMDIKKIMRTFPLSNEDVMTLENAMGTILSNSTAATQATPCIWVPYIISLLMSSLCILDFDTYHPLLGASLREKSHERSEWILAMSRDNINKYPIRADGIDGQGLRILIQMIPKSLGGYNGVNMYEFLMRGFPDNATRDLSYITRVYQSTSIPEFLKTSLQCWMNPIFMPDRNYSTVLEDVTAINLLYPRAPTAGIRQLVAKYMSSGVHISNDEFRELMSSKYKAMSDYLAECLCEGEELHIRLLHDIYESTIFGYVDGILSKVVKTATIQKLAIGDSKGAVFRAIERDELNYHRYFRWRSVQLYGTNKSNCPTEMCKWMRRCGWMKELRGVTTPFPAAYMEMTECGDSGTCSCDDGYISVHFPDGQMTNTAWNFDIGGNPPYLGSTTKEKVIVGAGGRIYSGEPLVRRPISLLKTINWFVPPESNAAVIIKQCVTAVTDLDPEPYCGVSEGTAGSEVHRYRDSSTSHGALTSSNFLYSTRYHISTDNFFRYSKGSENTDVHYQALFCYVLELANMRVCNMLRNGETMPRYLHFRQICYECINPIPEDFIDVPSQKAVTAIPTRQTNPYLFVSRDKIRVLERISPLSDLAERTMSFEQYSAVPGAEKTIWLQDVICDRIVTDILGGKEGDTHVSVGLLDVKSYERTMFLKLNPKYMIQRVLGQLWRVARWRARESKSAVINVSEADIMRTYTNLITQAGDHGFMGIAMFYCWDETAKRVNVYPEMVSPISNPVSISSACSAMRSNLLSLIIRRRVKMQRRCTIITEDEKYTGVVYKLILSEWADERLKCEECRAVVDTMDHRNLEWEIKHRSCRLGHLIWDRMGAYPWVRSAVTVERLRKDCESGSHPDPRPTLRAPTLTSGFVVDILSSNDVRWRATYLGYQPPIFDMIYQSPSDVTIYSLLTLKSLPTVTWYKWSDIASQFRKLIKNRKVFCVGDGLGTSGAVMIAYGATSVIISTLLEPDEAIPQTYVHNTSPMCTEMNTDKINDKLMIDRVNNVLDKQWESDWGKTTEDCSMLASDIEIIDRTRHHDRNTVFRKLVGLKRWDVAIIKDYLFDPAELANRLGILSAVCVSWRLVTSKLRSSFYPEVWWILTNVHSGKLRPVDSTVSVDARNMGGMWRNISGLLRDRYDDEEITEQDLTVLGLMLPLNGVEKMATYLRSWATFPIVGSILPANGAFTQLFLYLQKSKRPSYVKMQRESGKLKMYDSDYYALRERMFGLAVASVADIHIRLRLLSESETWHLDWYEKRKGSWWCRLIKDANYHDLPIKIVDYMPILSMLLAKESLIFENIDDVVEFRASERKRETVFFPISKNASLS